MDMAFAAIDCYRTTLDIAEMKLEDQELEAEAKAKIGRILLKIMKNSAKAHTSLYEAVVIGHMEENAHL
jgi:hypothetical protein